MITNGTILHHKMYNVMMFWLSTAKGPFLSYISSTVSILIHKGNSSIPFVKDIKRLRQNKIPVLIHPWFSNYQLWAFLIKAKKAPQLHDIANVLFTFFTEMVRYLYWWTISLKGYHQFSSRYTSVLTWFRYITNLSKIACPLMNFKIKKSLP